MKPTKRWIDYSNGWLGGFTAGTLESTSVVCLREGLVGYGVVAAATVVACALFVWFVTRPMLNKPEGP